MLTLKLPRVLGWTMYCTCTIAPALARALALAFVLDVSVLDVIEYLMNCTTSFFNHSTHHSIVHSACVMMSTDSICRESHAAARDVLQPLPTQRALDSSTDSERWTHSSLQEKFGWGSIMRYVVTLRWTPTTDTHAWVASRTTTALHNTVECDTLARLPRHCSWLTVWRGARWRGTLDAVDRLPVCTVVGASLRGGLFVLCRSVGVLCETRRPLSDRLAWRHCWTLCHALCDCVLGFFDDLAACFECFLFLSLALYHWTHWVYYE